MSAIITPIICPFAESGTKVTPPLGPATFVANQKTGYPDSQATPLPAGKEVMQDQTNGVLNFYTNLMFLQGQGYQYTFDATLSSIIGGYSEGAILWCASNSTWQRSLHIGNTANFITTPSFINDGSNWSTVTATPSIYNPSQNFLESICTSTTNVYANSIIYQKQISSSDATNGLMETRIKAEDTFANTSSEFFNSWYAVGIVPQPKIGSLLLTKDIVQRGIVAQGYVNSSNQLEYDMILYSNYGGNIIDSGIVLKQGYRPYLEPIGGSVTSLIMGLDSIMCFRDVRTKHYSDSVVDLNMLAIWNGSEWGVTLGGTINYNGASTNAPTIIYSLTTGFGIVGGNANSSNIGLISSTGGGVINSGKIDVSGSNLNLSASLTSAVTSAQFTFALVFQCTSLT